MQNGICITAISVHCRVFDMEGLFYPSMFELVNKIVISVWEQNWRRTSLFLLFYSWERNRENFY